MARQTREGRRISDELLDELLAGDDPGEVFRSGGLVDDLKKAVAERALDAEMDAHPEHEPSSGNHRNGHNRKRVLTDEGAMELEVPRDRAGLSPEDTVRTYKGLADVERWFRTFKGLDIRVRPIRHREERRVRAHLFLCLLAGYLEWHLRRAWAPLPATHRRWTGTARRAPRAVRRVRPPCCGPRTTGHSSRTGRGLRLPHPPDDPGEQRPRPLSVREEVGGGDAPGLRLGAYPPIAGRNHGVHERPM